jgi:WD40 repeat protein
VADFGLAKSFEAAQELTQTQELIGTPAYMSPEQASCPAKVDHRTDIYSLGATLYELLTGRPPFRAATLVETHRQVIENEPVSPRQLNPAVDRDLETVCLKCLEKDPERRYPTAEALADEFDRYRQGKPIHARPINRLARCWRWCKRNRTIAFVGTAAAILLLVLAIGGPVAALNRSALLEEKTELLGERTGLLKDRTRLLGQKTAALDVATFERKQAETARDDADDARKKTQRTLYVSDMRLVQEYWEPGHIEVCRRLLERYLPKAGEAAGQLRSFEWYYWWRQCHQHLMTLKHQNQVQQVAVSSNGQLLAAAEMGGAITLWDLETGEPKRTFRLNDRDCAALALSRDGKTLAAAGAQGNVAIWDIASGEMVYQFLYNVIRGVPACVAFDADCTRFAWSLMGAVCVHARSEDPKKWTVLEGQLEGIYISCQEGTVASHWTTGAKIRFSKEWSLADESAPPRREYGGPALAITFSNDGALLAAGGREGRVKLWDTATAKQLATLEGHVGIVWSVAISPDARTLASAGADGKIVLWDAKTGTEKMTISAHTNAVVDVLFVCDGNTLASAGLDSSIKFWDANTGRLFSTLKGHEASVSCLAPFPDGQRVASACQDGTVKMWSVPNRNDSVFLDISMGMIVGVAFSPDGRQLAAVVRDDPADAVRMPAGFERFRPGTSTQKLILWDSSQGMETT